MSGTNERHSQTRQGAFGEHFLPTSSHDFNYKSFLKSCFVYSLPHLVLLCIFLAYAILGASILNEIESNNKNYESTNDNEVVGISSSASSSIDNHNTNQKCSKLTASNYNKLKQTRNDNFLKAIGNEQADLNKMLVAYFKKKNSVYEDKLVVSLNQFYLDSNRLIQMALNNSTSSNNNSTSKVTSVMQDQKNQKNPKELKDNKEQKGILKEQKDTKESKALLKEQKNFKEQKVLHKEQNENPDVAEAVKFITKLYNSQKKNLNVLSIFKSIAKHLVEFKSQMKDNLLKQLRVLIEAYQFKHAQLRKKYMNDLLKDHEMILKKNQNIIELIELESKQKLGDIDEEVDINLICSSNSPKADQVSEEVKKNQQQEWNFSVSFYYVGSLLTKIGYGDIKLQTNLGKIFIMIYLLIGVPLTLILLNDLGIIFTRLIKFSNSFIIIMYNEGYLTDLLVFFRIKSATNTEDVGKDSDESMNKWNQLADIIFTCIETSDDSFDQLSLGFLSGWIFFYTSIGALVSSRLASWSFVNGFYFTLTSLTKIGLGDLVLPQVNKIIFIIICIYILFGLAFIDLTMMRLKIKIRGLIVRNCQNILKEFCKFFNQFGYELRENVIDFDSSIANGLSKSDEKFDPSNLQDKLDADQEKRLEQQRQEQMQQAARLLALNKRPKGSLGSKDRNSLVNEFYAAHVIKCDKQTQITTLLRSEFKLDKAVSLENLYIGNKKASFRQSSATRATSFRTEDSLEIPYEETFKSVIKEETSNEHKLKEKKNIEEENGEYKKKMDKVDEDEVTISVSFHPPPSASRPPKPLVTVKTDDDNTIDKEASSLSSSSSSITNTNDNFRMRRNRFASSITSTTNSSSINTSSTTPTITAATATRTNPSSASISSNSTSSIGKTFVTKSSRFN